MRVVGVDPGVTGAMALIVDGNLLQVADLPVSDGQVNGRTFVAHLFDMDPDVVYVERTQPMPKNGSIASYKLGLNSGVIIGAVTAMRHPLHKVRPQEWKKPFHLIGKDKEASRLTAIENFPLWEPLLRRKKDHNRADAVLIAQFGWMERKVMEGAA